MNRFKYLSVDAKIVFLVSLSELVIDHISASKGYGLAVESMEKCWEWVRIKGIKANDLYHYLENTDEADVMTYMKREDDINRKSVWKCVADALAYTVSEAYQYEKQKDIPEIVKCVGHETAE